MFTFVQQNYIELIKNDITDAVDLNSEETPALLRDTVKSNICGQTIKYVLQNKKERINK